MKIGITGATGQLGRIVIEKLIEKVSVENIVALVRNPEKAADLVVKVSAFDYNKTEGLAESLKGIDILLLISGNEVGKRAIQHGNVIDVAKKADVKRIVYTSLLHADTSTLSLAAEHLATEKMLKESGIPSTILRNGWYTENYTGSIKGAVAAGAFIGSAGNGKISMAARIDFAEAAVVVLTSEGHIGKVYELAGDNANTLTDLAKEISLQTGKNIPYNNLPVKEYAEILTKYGLPAGLALSIAGWDFAASTDNLFNDSKQLSKLIGRPTTTLAKVIADTLAG